MYPIMFVISFSIRNFILPNPFACFGLNQYWLNPLCDLFVAPVSFGLGKLCGYRRGDNPAIGSFLYLLFYSIITLLLYVIVPIVAKNKGL